MRIFVALLLGITLAGAGCLDQTQSQSAGGLKRLGALTPEDHVAQAKATPHAVVALIDTGINPYHKTFRDPRPEAYLHPSKYISHYPEDAIALNITLDHPNYWLAVKQDCETIWKEVKPGRLYWFPGTKIIGAVTLQAVTSANCSREQPQVSGILDAGGHGTMVASRAASFEYGACQECKVVAIQGFNRFTVEWGMQNSNWIDAQSNSWGPVLPLMAPNLMRQTPAGGFVGDSELIASIEKAAQTHLSFWASGNGALTRGGLVGHVTLIDPRMTPSIVMVGGHDSGYVNTWPDFPPHVVSDSCDSWAAYHRNTTASADNVGGGTSGASPYAAGGAAQLLLEARRLLNDTRTGIHDGIAAQGTPPAHITSGPLADGKFTLAEWKTLLFKTATARPVRQYEDGAVCDLVSGLVLYSSTPVMWKDVPAQYPEYVHIGYGAVDNQSRALAMNVLLGQQSLPDRSRTDQYFAAEAPVRNQLHNVFKLLP